MIPVAPHFIDEASDLTHNNLERIKKYIEWELKENLDIQQVLPYGIPIPPDLGFYMEDHITLHPQLTDKNDWYLINNEQNN